MRVAVVGAGGADHFVAYRVDRADVVDEAPVESTGSFSPRASISLMRLCAASRPVSRRPESSSVSPGSQLAISSRVMVSRLTRRDSAEAFHSILGQSSSEGGVSTQGRCHPK